MSIKEYVLSNKFNFKMKFIVQLEIFCFAFNFQLVKSQTLNKSNGTVYVKHANGTIMVEQPKNSNNSQHNQQDQHSEHNQNKLTTPETSDGHEPLDQYTFVALIEIMFNDGSRKNCTGAIIHDNVVITAAHCFENEKLSSSQPELTGSFVILGTKQMFDTGYEQYLPIERILIHPDYKGYHADLALVYTFAGMMSDKPGDIIPMAEGNSYSSLHSNVTVLSWDHVTKNVRPGSSNTNKGDSCSQSSEDKDTYFYKEVTRPILSSINDWTKENTMESGLSTKDYTIFEIDSCKKLVRKLQPAIYQIESVNKTLCYYTKYPNKVQTYSGAPAINRNHLVAIAAGDLTHHDEHVIIATKLICYCTWIGENLPSGGDQLQCCKNCCTDPTFKAIEEIYF